MSKRRPLARPPSRKRRPYDAEMISDFVFQLLWELRIRHFEHVNPGKINPELVEQIGRANKKHANTGLLWLRRVRKEEPVTAAEMSEFYRLTTEHVQAQIDALELLMKGPPNEAIKQASMPGVMLSEYVDIRAFIAEHRKPE